MDDQLRAIAEKVEKGETSPWLWLVCGSVLILGVPQPSQALLEEIEARLPEEYAASLANRPRRERKREQRNPVALAEADIAIFNQSQTDCTALTLAPAEWQPLAGTGYAYRVPALRVPLNAVDAWWVVGLEQVAEPGRQSMFTIGGFIPLSN